MSNIKSKKKSLGEVLRKERAILGLTLRQVEESANISNAYLSQLENDKIKKPSANVLSKLASLYNVPIDKFLFASGIISDEPERKAGMLKTIRDSQKLSKEEEDRLLEYLKFLRSKK